ncbi:7749_t:CDS:1 [Racocetra persica]|uniref:7749_t:CDS:1 n=1 Tax=Racocetra persica TaxID=160502 RepID=A0ACA9RU44_9GLOM|nr:7749_t:CDS:1 [Racocetra persica]
MNNSTSLNIMNPYKEVFYNDSDKDFKILDNGDNSGGLDETISTLLSTFSTNTTDIDANICNLYLDETAIEVARVYANSVLQEQVDESSIDWLESDLDMESNKESLCEVDCYQDDLKIKICSENTK